MILITCLENEALNGRWYTLTDTTITIIIVIVILSLYMEPLASRIEISAFGDDARLALCAFICFSIGHFPYSFIHPFSLYQELNIARESSEIY